MNKKLMNILSFPQYNINLPSNNKSIFFRPMTVREENSLLLAKQSEDAKNIFKTVYDILKNCYGEENILKYSLADFEYCFLKLREKSVGEIEQVNVTCPHTGEKISSSINLSTDIKIIGKKQKNKIKIDNNLIVKFKEPTFELLLDNPDYNKTTEKRFEFIADCILEIQKNDQIISSEDFSKKELQDFIGSLSSKQFKEILDYFDNIQRIAVSVKYTTSDGENREIEILGTINLINFFFDYINLQTYYSLLFNMKYHHNYNMEEIHNMIPWEREVFVKLITNELEKEKNMQDSYLQ